MRVEGDDAEAAAWAPEGDGVGDLGDPARPLLGADDRAELRGEVAFHDVSFRYQKRGAEALSDAEIVLVDAA